MPAPLAFLGGLLALYLLAPLLALLWHLGPQGWAGLRAPGLVGALGVSAASATLSTLVIALTGIPLAYGLARGRSRWLGTLGVLVQLPLAVPPLAARILLVFLFGPYTPLGRLLGGGLTESLGGIVLAQTFVASPFLIVAARSAFAGCDPTLEGVAATLGHGPWGRFRRVALPGAWPGIRAGLLLAWVRALGEFGATMMVAYHPYSLPVYTFVQFGGEGLAATIAPLLAALLLALGVFLLSAATGGVRLRSRAARLAPVPPAPLLPAGAGAVGGPLTVRLAADLGGFRLDLDFAATSRQVVLLGPSGSGKSLTLRLLAGLDRPDAGFVRWGAEVLSDLPVERRGLGYVPQDYGLLPHLPVWAQANFGRAADPALAAAWLRRLDLEALAHRLPAQLSGGQRQRVALLRALACHPRLLLLDEPFSALDAPVRDALRRELRRLQREEGLATLLVTHDPLEARLLAQEVVVLDAGRVLQAGPVRAVFARPASPHVARLLGVPNVFAACAVGDRLVQAAGLRMAVADPLPDLGPPGAVPGWVVCAIRPEHVRLEPGGDLEGVVLDVLDTGYGHEVSVGLAPGLELRADHAGAPPEVGGRCRLTLAAEHVRAWCGGAAG